jgi:hypothetical protein
MQPFPDFNLFRVIESDLAQLRERRTQQRISRQDVSSGSNDGVSFFSRLLGRIATSEQATTSSACGD